jgi:hypothetical protein
MEGWPMEARHQCPFVNRPDARCSGRLKIDRLDYAFEFCFDAYNTCPVYIERLLERRTRRAAVESTSHGRQHDYGSTLVQLGTPATARATSAA